MGPFELALSNFAEETLGDGGDADAAIRGIVFDLGGEIVVNSPVDEGRFRNNWFYSVNVPTAATTEATNKNATTYHSAPMPGPADRVHYLQNNLPYGPRLERGWSDQAPNGMVGKAVRRFDAIVDKNARERRR